MDFERYLLVATLVLSAGVSCDDKKAESEPAKQADAPKQEPAAAEEDPSGEDRQWCAEAHADTVKLIEAMKETMARNKQDAGDAYDVPAKSEYVEACQKLPARMQKCLVLSHAMKNKRECQAAQDALGPDEQKIYSELMGK